MSNLFVFSSDPVWGGPGPNKYIYRYDICDVTEDLTFRVCINDHCDQLIEPEVWTLKTFRERGDMDDRLDSVLIEAGVMLPRPIALTPDVLHALKTKLASGYGPDHM